MRLTGAFPIRLEPLRRKQNSSAPTTSGYARTATACAHMPEQTATESAWEREAGGAVHSAEQRRSRPPPLSRDLQRNSTARALFLAPFIYLPAIQRAAPRSSRPSHQMAAPSMLVLCQLWTPSVLQGPNQRASDRQNKFSAAKRRRRRHPGRTGPYFATFHFTPFLFLEAASELMT